MALVYLSLSNIIWAFLESDSDRDDEEMTGGTHDQLGRRGSDRPDDCFAEDGKLFHRVSGSLQCMLFLFQWNAARRQAPSPF